MDRAGMWRSMRADPADAPRPGAHQETAGPGITISVTQQCQIALPLAGLTPDEVTVTVTSHRPRVAAQVSIAANFNSPDGSYQGPTTTVGQGQFTARRSHVRAGFVVLPSGWPARWWPTCGAQIRIIRAGSLTGLWGRGSGGELIT